MDKRLIKPVTQYIASVLNSKSMPQTGAMTDSTASGEVSIRSLEERLRNKTEWQPAAVYGDSLTLVKRIRRETKEFNRNNVTRTRAYLDFYSRNPDLHWAFLAHMVSRNGGWNMTDLKGSLLKGVIGEKTRESYFSFLEAANYLIFNDAYPQLRLYEESRKSGNSFSELLQVFSVSSFMKPVWDIFSETGDRAFLTAGLIINEQHYIQKRIVENPGFIQSVFSGWQFQVQEMFQLTSVIFPRRKRKRVPLSGIKVSSFTEPGSRIKTGLSLYSLLFGNRKRRLETEIFAKGTPHTGSREDYWPHMFSGSSKAAAGRGWHSCTRVEKPPFLYSPSLEQAWADSIHGTPSRDDWYAGQEIIEFFRYPVKTETPELSKEYCLDLHTMWLFQKAKNHLQ
ncbi:DUF2515 family protein [Alteribacter natronophilus]|uniref:DUF2515 family protein n=1 Tax=Alteribacter natronophilus TaxID=2583810 RepID=UPI001486C8E0|nr:DUF2515 family protein [Alteribacter natronophilus]